MKRRMICILASALGFCLAASGQQIDTVGIYGERTDSLEAAVFTGSQAGSYMPRLSGNHTEVISGAGLHKLACCSLAESFENSASVTVGYSDAVTGARQIRLLGLSGTYTQMLDEARPTMRGLAAPFGLTFVPGSWMESIQVAKGASSVMNGTEAITGGINVEYRKPTDEKPLFLNASIMNDTKTDFNVASSLQLNDDLSTVILGHVDGNFMAMDHNGDGFADDPKQLQFNLSNRWLYNAPDESVWHWGVRAIRDSRQGGQLESTDANAWKSDILNQQLGAYLKIGKPLCKFDENGNEIEGPESSIAFIADYSLSGMDSNFGWTTYDVLQHSLYLSFLYKSEINENNSYVVGANSFTDLYNENFARGLHPALAPIDQNYKFGRDMLQNGLFGEYTYKKGEELSVVAGARADLFEGEGVRVSPRLTARWSPSNKLTLRLNGGRGLRFSNPLIDNIGVLSTNKVYTGTWQTNVLEDAWISGASATWYFGGSSSTYLSFDVFHTEFANQQILDYKATSIDFYELADIDGGRSYTDNFQVDFNCEPARGLTLTTTFRYTNAKCSYVGQGLVEKPMTSRFKGVFNTQYTTRDRRWIFDGTLSINGPCRVYDFMGYEDNLSPVYPLLYMQVTHRMRGFDFYVGGENLTGFRQKDVILSDPSKSDFDASCIWGPIMGAKIYAGFRFTLWKTVK